MHCFSFITDYRLPPKDLSFSSVTLLATDHQHEAEIKTQALQKSGITFTNTCCIGQNKHYMTTTALVYPMNDETKLTEIK